METLCIDTVKALLSRAAETSDLYEKADLANQITATATGWTVLEGDRRRLWRTTDGQTIHHRLTTGDVVTLCQHPWIDGVNTESDRSVDPVFNYHRNAVDWREFVLEHARSRSALAQLLAPSHE